MNSSYTVTYNSIYNFFWGGAHLFDPPFDDEIRCHLMVCSKGSLIKGVFGLAYQSPLSGSWKNLILSDFHARFDDRILIRTGKVHEMMTSPYGNNMGQSNKPNFNKRGMRDTVIVSATVQYHFFISYQNPCKRSCSLQSILESVSKLFNTRWAPTSCMSSYNPQETAL